LLYTTADIVVITMTIIDLTPQQLKRAAAIKEQVDALNKEFRSLLGGSLNNRAKVRKKQTPEFITGSDSLCSLNKSTRHEDC
jgi:hypothetical protein